MGGSPLTIRREGRSVTLMRFDPFLVPPAPEALVPPGPEAAAAATEQAPT